MAELEPCGCDFCEAERWVERQRAEPATPIVARVWLEEFAAELAARRAPRGRLDRLRAWWAGFVDGFRDSWALVADEPSAVLFCSVWSSLWFWSTVVWALVVGGWALRVLALVAAACFLTVNLAGLRAVRRGGRD